MALPQDGLYTAGTGERRTDDAVRDHLRVRLPIPGETLDLDTLSLTQATWIRSLAVQENPGSSVELRLDLYRNGVLANDYVMPVVTVRTHHNSRSSDPAPGDAHVESSEG